MENCSRCGNTIRARGELKYPYLHRNRYEMNPATRNDAQKWYLRKWMNNLVEPRNLPPNYKNGKEKEA